MIQLVVSYLDGQTRYFPVRELWKLDTMTRCLVIDKGVPRTIVPLDNVSHFSVERTVMPKRLTDRCQHEPEKGCMWCCDRCNYDRHLCGGCGDPIPHGEEACEGCLEGLDGEKTIRQSSRP